MNIRKKNQRGVALMLVLSAIVIITTMAVEFAYNTNVNHHLAQNELNRLQSYYLAKSAYNFMLLELKFDRVFRQVVQSQNLGQYLGANAQLPLCQQFPLSTGLIRAVFSGGGVPGLGGAEGGAGGTGEEGEREKGAQEAVEELRKGTSMAEESSAEAFLEFEGDFDAECVDESTKINLNGFAGLAATPSVEGGVSPLDQYKQFLLRFLSRPQFEDLFKAADVRIPDVVENIADWIDQDTGGGHGAEDGPYGKLEVSYKVRNNKLMTLLEAYQIDGVVDDWFAPMIELFTIYGDGKINVCTASQEVVEGVIRRYVESTPGLPPMRLEDPEEMGRLITAVVNACSSGAMGEQLKSQISQALTAAIGAVSSGEPPPAAPPPPQPGGPAAPQAAPQNTGFASYLSTESRFFSLKLAGQIGDITVRIKAVLDVKETDPKKWRVLYWRVY